MALLFLTNNMIFFPQLGSVLFGFVFKMFNSTSNKINNIVSLIHMVTLDVGEQIVFHKLFGNFIIVVSSV